MSGSKDVIKLVTATTCNLIRDPLFPGQFDRQGITHLSCRSASHRQARCGTKSLAILAAPQNTQADRLRPHLGEQLAQGQMLSPRESESCECSQMELCNSVVPSPPTPHRSKSKPIHASFLSPQRMQLYYMAVAAVASRRLPIAPLRCCITTSHNLLVPRSRGGCWSSAAVASCR